VNKQGGMVWGLRTKNLHW